MKQNTVIQLNTPGSAPEDPLTELLRNGARTLIQEAVKAEFEEFLSKFADERLEDGRRAVVKNGFLPKREIQTGIGAVEVEVPKARDRRPGNEKAKFNSGLLPPYLRKTMSVENLLPWLYLKGISAGDFQEALSSLLGPNAAGLSSSTVCRLKQQWLDEHDDWSRGSLAKKRYVYWWADGVYFNVRGEEANSCVLVIVGVTKTGHKEFVAIEEGLRESELSWLEVLNNLKNRGLSIGPELAVGDGSLGFWKALSKTYSNTRQQRCWVHKTANVLNKLPKSSQKKAKEALHDIWMAETRQGAHAAFDTFVETYQDKYPKVADCLAKDRQELLAFYDFPAPHWQHIRTTNPVESTFATVRLRTAKTRGCVSRKTILSLVYKLGMSAQKRWRKLRGFHHLADVISGVKFADGIKVENKEAGGITAA